MTAKRIVVIIVGFAVGAFLTLGIMGLGKNDGLMNFGLPNFLLTTFCFGCAVTIILDGLMHTNMLKR
ncbi:hypothetical protein TFLX_04428 [Thermoflexales bacterium]|nr:hypothetical protein TFLX_04428 [Thermoflexales bacterium]